jgi:hypothetical protein
MLASSHDVKIPGLLVGGRTTEDVSKWVAEVMVVRTRQIRDTKGEFIRDGIVQ